MTLAVPTPGFLELDLASEQGFALLRASAERHGDGVVRATRLASRLFLLRSPWAPGLRFVGGQTMPQQAAAQHVFSLSGAGETLEDAFVACIGEAIDRLSQIEWPGDVNVSASLPDVKERVLPSAIPLIEQHLESVGLPRTAPLDWLEGAVTRISGARRPVLLPADWCLRRANDRARLTPPTVLSVGVAAGPDNHWAAGRALLELIERDAASLWWIGGRRGRPVALDRPHMSEVVRLLRSLRQGTQARRSWLLDITTDIGLSVIAALSCSANGRELACGLAARQSLQEAACAAILELCQIELGILLAACKLAEAGEGALTTTDRAHLERARLLDADRCELLHPLGAPATQDVVDGRPALSVVLEALTASEIDAALIDLTRPDTAIPVVRAIAPVLQPMPSEIVTARLKQALVETGGGAQYHGGITLL